MASYGLSLIKRTGGVDTSDANAGPYQILKGYSGYVDDERVDGTMPNRGAYNYSLPVNSSHNIPDGWHNGSGKITQSLATQGSVTITPGTSAKMVCAANRWTTGDLWVKGDADLVAGNIKNGVKMFGLTGTYKGCVTTDATVTADKILTGYSAYGRAGTKINGTMPNRGAISHSLAANGSYTVQIGLHNGSGKVTQSLSTQASTTTTPGTASKLVCAASKWTTGNLWVKGDADLVAGNIKNGVKLFGLTGTYKGCVTTDATVTADKILTGYSAYGSGGTKINGTMPNRGAISHALSANGSYTIPTGWHNGSGKVTQSLTTQAGKTVTPGTGNILLCSASRWVTGDIWATGDSNLKAENIKKGVTIFGISGSFDFPSPTQNEDGDFVLTIFENGKFVRGGLTNKLFCQEKGNQRGNYDSYTEPAIANWVRNHPPTLTNAGLGLYGSHISSTNLYETVCYGAVIKVPIPAGMQRATLKCKATLSTDLYINNSNIRDTHNIICSYIPDERWPSGNWKVPVGSYSTHGDPTTNRWYELFMYSVGAWYSGSSTSDRWCGGHILSKIWAKYIPVKTDE